MTPERAECGLASDRETELMGRVQRRDSAALADLYDLYGGLVYSLIFRIVYDRGIAEDLVQETFLRVWTRAGLFDNKRAFRPWLFSVARNRALDYRRGKSDRWNGSAATLHETEDPKVLADLERTVRISENIRILSGPLSKLNMNQRTVVNLAYFEGYSQAEMATRLRTPIGTVKTWVRAALNVLREELAARPGGLGKNEICAATAGQEASSCLDAA